MTGIWHRFYFLAVVSLVVDQLSKLLVVRSLSSLQESVWALPFLNIVYELNPGVAFSLGADLGSFGRWFFIAVALAIITGLLFYLRTEPSPRRAVAFGLIVGGALGNMVDRLRISAVIDWLDFHAFGYHYPTFNVADAAIFVGACLFLYDNLRPAPTR